MKLALIPPIELLEYTERTSVQLALPHLMKNDTYRYVYQRHCDDPNQFVILDNGVAEGEMTSTADLVNLGDLLGVDEIVIPDVLKDARGTRNEYNKFKSWIADNIGPEFWDRTRTMYVIQGRNEDEFYEQAMLATSGRFRARTIGIPRHAIETCNNPKIRYDLAKIISRKSPGRSIHLLGASPAEPWEMASFAGARWVRSTDTSSPFNFAFVGERINSARGIRRPADYFELPHERFDHDALSDNVRQLLKWCKEAS